MKCTCVEEINKLLKPKGEQLDIAFDLKGGRFFSIRAIKSFGGRGKATLFLAKFCPFCGDKQEEA